MLRKKTVTETIQLSFEKYEPYAPVPVFTHLRGDDVISAQVSDHHPVMHDDVLFWNIMMQGRMRKKENNIGFNNGFGLVETDAQYRQRLIKVAQVIAEMIHYHPEINIVSLCEGPVRSSDVSHFYAELSRFSVLNKFLRQPYFHTPDQQGDQWGLLMLANHQFAVKTLRLPDYFQENELVNRVMLWELQSAHENKYLLLAHLPFGSDERATTISQLSSKGLGFIERLQRLKNSYDRKDKHLIIAADYNFNPALIDGNNDLFGYHIPANNSIVLSDVNHQARTSIQRVTVDGILLSKPARQKYNAVYANVGLFGKFKAERRLAHQHERSVLSDNRHESAEAQRRYDNRYGLVPYK